MLGTELGLDMPTENYAAYCQNWLQALRNDKNEIFRAARDANKIVDFIRAFAGDVVTADAADLQPEAADLVAA